VNYPDPFPSGGRRRGRSMNHQDPRSGRPCHAGRGEPSGLGFRVRVRVRVLVGLEIELGKAK